MESRTVARSEKRGPPLGAAALLLALLCAALYRTAPDPVNAALHAANAVLVFALGCALGGRARASGASRISEAALSWSALAGAALFAAHPLQVEAVRIDTQRANLIAALGSLAAAVCFLHGRGAGHRFARGAWWGAAGAAWLLALGARESALALPVAIALCEWLVSGQPEHRRLARWLPAGLALALGTAVLALGQARAIALYESLLVLPLPARLNVAHDPTIGTPIALVLHAVVLGFAAAFARRSPIASFAVLWFYLHHVAEAAVAPGMRAAEHRNYLALAGPALGAGYALFAALPRRLGMAAALSVLAATALGAVAYARGELWRDPFALWHDAVAKSPGSATARIERGVLLEQQDRYEEALADFSEAVRLDPGSARARAHLAASLAGAGRAREALEHAREAVAQGPEDAAAHASLGRIEALLGDPAAAAAAFERALTFAPAPELDRRLGDALVSLGRFEDALDHYRAALERAPGDDDARAGAGAALVELGRARDALAYLEHAVESQPDPRYLAYFGDALWQIGDTNGAIEAVSMAVRVAPDWPGATSRLAWMLALTPVAERRDPARALRIADAALARGVDSLVLDARAAALAAAGRFTEARADAERAADIARDAGAPALAASIAAHAERYARRELWQDPPRPFEASP